MIDKVTYNEIVEALSRKTGFSKQKCETFAKALIQEIKAELKKNGKASITNFGSFKVKDVAERQGQNPQTGEPITIPAHKRVTFSPYKALRTRVNAKYEHLEAELVDDNAQEEAAFAAGKPEEAYEEAVKDQSNRFYLILAAALLLIIISLGLLWVSSNWGADQMTETETRELPITDVPTNETVPNAEDEASDPSESAEDDMTADEQMINELDTETNTITTMDESNSPQSDITYQVQDDEWYWVIAEKEYGEAHYWPIIFQENFTVNHHPDSLETNTSLAIPSFEGTIGSLTALDYQRLSEASQMVSEAYANFGRNDKAEGYARFAVRWKRMAGDQ